MTNGGQSSLGYTKPESLNDGVRKILVQSETSQVSRGPLETGIPFEPLFEVDAVL